MSASVANAVAFLSALCTLALLYGLGLVVRGVRGERIGDEPRCRRCGFDLSGSEGSERCAECGTGLQSPHAIGHGLRRSRWRPAIVGALLVAFGGAGFLWIAAGRSWTAVAPTRWLAAVEYRWSDPQRRMAISREIGGRIAKGTAPPDAAMPIVRLASAEQTRLARSAETGGPSGPYDEAGLDLAFDAAAAGLLTAAELDALLLDAVDISFAFDPPLRAGEVRPRITVRGTRGTSPTFPSSRLPPLEVEIVAVEVGGRTVHQGGATMSLSPSRGGSGSIGPTLVATDLPAGVHDAIARVALRTDSGERRVERAASVEILAADRVVPRDRIEAALRTLLEEPSLRRRGADGRTIVVSTRHRSGEVELRESVRLVLVDDEGIERDLGYTSVGWRGSADGTTGELHWTFTLPPDAPPSMRRALLRVTDVRVTPGQDGKGIEGFSGWLPLGEPIEIELRLPEEEASRPSSDPS